MADLTRRNFLTKTSLGVAAGLAAMSGLAVPNLVSVATEAPETESVAPNLAELGDDLVAFVRNASSGEVAVMSGTHEVVYDDPQLVGRLLDAARRLSPGG